MERTVSNVLTELIRVAASTLEMDVDSVPLEPCVPTKDPAHGDYQSNFAFRLGKAQRINPRDVAQRMVDALPEHAAVAKALVAGPGFINFTLNDEWLASDLSERASSDRFGTPQSGHGKTMVIDYSSPNVAKRMHIVVRLKHCPIVQDERHVVHVVEDNILVHTRIVSAQIRRNCSLHCLNARITADRSCKGVTGPRCPLEH